MSTSATPQKMYTWDENLERLEAFVAKHGRVIRATEKHPDYPGLSAWLRNQRVGRHLTAGKESLLDRRVPGWRGPRPGGNTGWQQNFERLQAFVAETGRYPTPDNDSTDSPSLATWIRDQRHKGKLTNERAAILDAHLPGWREGNRLVRESQWEQNLERLIAQAARHPGQFTEQLDDGQLPHLGSWLERQRRGIGLTPARRQLLDDRAPGWNQERSAEQ